jgi:hypothetical protein
MKRPVMLIFMYLMVPFILFCDNKPFISSSAKGYWSGQNDLGGETRFTVSADGKYVCGFFMSWPKYPGACGLINYEAAYCVSIDTNSFNINHSTPNTNGRSDGVFTSDTTVIGTWHASSSFPSCNRTGKWTANVMEDGPFSCSQDGSVEICIWLNNPNPKKGSKVIAYVQLLNDGIGQNEHSVHITWNDNHGTTGSHEMKTGSAGYGLSYCEIGRIGNNDIVIEVEIDYLDRIYTNSIKLLVTG